MYPILIKIGGVPINSFGFFLGFGYILSVITSCELGKKLKINSQLIVDLHIWILITGILGGRLAELLYQWDLVRAHPMMFFTLGEFDFFGAFFLGGLIFIILIKEKGKSFLCLGDIFVCGLTLAQMFGHIGCFLDGRNFGKSTILPIRVTYPLFSQANGYYQELMPVHPVQLYESMGCGILFLGLMTLYDFKKWNGQVLCFYGMGYGLLRFVIDPFRGEQVCTFYEFTLPQVFSLILFLTAFISYFLLGFRSRS